MAVFELFSKRQKRLKGETPEIYNYDKIPEGLRVQIIHIIWDSIGKYNIYSISSSNETYQFITDVLCREFALFDLGGNINDTIDNRLLGYFLKTSDKEAIDIIELSFKYIDRVIRKNEYYQNQTDIKQSPTEAIEELNIRFKEHGVGYQFESGQLIRLDSTISHSEIIKPTINLLFSKKFLGANEEYLKALEHYRHGRNKECLVECLKAFESTLKIICKEKHWKYEERDTAKQLIQKCFQNNLIPTYSQNQFTSLLNLLESGIPSIRNKVGGHGQGQVPQKVDNNITRYGLNLTGTNIIFLVELSKIK